MATPRSSSRKRPRRRPRRETAAAVHAAALRAVDQVLSSSEALAMLLQRLEAAGWHIEREAELQSPRTTRAAALTPPARAR